MHATRHALSSPTAIGPGGTTRCCRQDRRLARRIAAERSFGRDLSSHADGKIAEQSGGSARGYQELLAPLADDIPGYSLAGVGQGRARQAGAEAGAEEDQAQAGPAHRAGRGRPGSPGKAGCWFGEAADAGIVLNAARRRNGTPCLATRMRDRAAGYLRFARDSRIPSGNNQAEQVIRMSKLRIKVSGGHALNGRAPGPSAPSAPTWPPLPAMASAASMPLPAPPKAPHSPGHNRETYLVTTADRDPAARAIAPSTVPGPGVGSPSASPAGSSPCRRPPACLPCRARQTRRIG